MIEAELAIIISEVKLLLPFMIILSLAALIIGCGAAVTPLNTELSITLKDNSILPGVWRVPSGAVITLHLSNQDPAAHQLVILFRTTATLKKADLAASIFWSHSIAGEQSETLQFTAPAAPGNYEIAGLENLDDGMTAKMTVMNPAEVQAISP